jgi:hypothetical protein
MLRTNLVLILFLSTNLISVRHASAQGEISSNYDRFKFESCPRVRNDEQWALWRCVMENGPNFLVQKTEHSAYFMPETEYSYSRNNDESFKWAKSAHFGDLVANHEDVITIEWRVEAVDGVWTPFAAIFRTSYGMDEYTGQRLDIVKFGSDHACPIAAVNYIGAVSNVRAREIADAAWGTNPCPNIDPANVPRE